MIRDAERKSLSAISDEMKDLAARAREKKLKPEEYQGGVGAISNLGMYGVREFAAIINPPQSTILAVGAAQRRPVETDDGGVRFDSADERHPVLRPSRGRRRARRPTARRPQGLSRAAAHHDGVRHAR